MNAFAWGQGWHIVGWTMIYFLLAGAAVLFLGAVLRFALRKASPTLRYTTSLAVFAVIALLPFLIAGSLASRGAGTAAQQWSAPGQVITSHMVALSEQIELNATPSNDAEKQALLMEGRANSVAKVNSRQPVHHNEKIASLLTTAVEYLPWVWIVGTPLTFLLLASGLVGAERLRRTSRPLDTGPIIETCETLRKALNVGRRVSVAICDRVATPLLVGIVRPLILLPPAALTGWSPAELEMVLLHELAHVRRWDNLVNLAQRVVESLLFFHPAVWIASRWVRRDREDCCDAVVISYTAKPQAYAELLLSLASPQAHGGLATSAAMSDHPVAGRIRRILNLEDEPMLVSRNTLIAISTGVLSLVLTVVLVAPHSTDAEEPATKPEESRVVPDPDSEESEPKASRERQRPEETELTIEARSRETKYPAELEIMRSQRTFSDPKAAEIWEATQITLLKSQSVLSNAYASLNEELKKSSVFPDGIDPISWLSENLSVEINETAIGLRLPGKQSQRAELLKILQAIRKSYIETLAQDLAPQSSPLFPTLEEQRMADVAYKLLRVELEKLSPDELEFVRAKGYQGGLRVASLEGGLPFNSLLVGLHVWPTKSLDQVNEILTRDDLDQLSPLKYYVISRGGPFGGGGSTRNKNGVETGRINVDLNAWRELPEIKALNEEQQRRTQDEQEEVNQEQSKKALLYDGKTFVEWKTRLETELKYPKRTECVSAIAAFGRAGRGKDAAQALLAVAGKSPWGDPRHGAKGMSSIERTVLESFRAGLPSEITIPVILQAADDENPNLRNFAAQVAPYLAARNPDSEKQLRIKFPDMKLPEGRPQLFNYPTTREKEPLNAAPLFQRENSKGLQLAISPYNKKPLVGSRSTYQFFVENNGTSSDEQIQLTIKFPPEIIPDMAALQSVVPGNLVDNEIRFAPIAGLREKERLSFTIATSVLKAGIFYIEANVKSKNLPEGVEATERVEIVGF